MNDQLAGELLTSRKRDRFMVGIGAGVLATAAFLLFHGQDRFEDNSPVAMAVDIAKCDRDTMPRHELYCDKADAIQFSRDLAAGEELTAGVLGLIGLVTALPRIDRLKQGPAVKRYISSQLPANYNEFNQAWFAYQDQPTDQIE